MVQMRGKKVKALKKKFEIPHPGRKMGGNLHYWFKFPKEKEEADESTDDSK